MSIKPIRTRAEHERALTGIERLMGAKRGSPQAHRLEVLVALVTAYEATHDPIDLPEPIEAIEAHMAERGLGQADLARLLGSRSLASAIQSKAVDVIDRHSQARERMGHPDRCPRAALPTGRPGFFARCLKRTHGEQT